MSTVITRTSDSATATPILVTGYDARREGRNVTHDMLDGTIVVTLIDPRPRSGTLSLLFSDEADANAAMLLHATSDTYTLAVSERPTLDMTYVAGGLGISLEDQTRDLWLVTVDFQEIVE